ncbi:hypothetical protein CCR75_008658 [Bremia lactucae]|uniref:Uncharacterized protein n=2 Tax=Bremia lactucae TaxID=4779 RepID=A0A976IIN4_BRELC|nr:hypothetical protein CCR75_008658 [Bremia lactucae]
MASDDEDAVYASILANIQRSERREKLQRVVRREYRSISRRLRHVIASWEALRQLQMASEQLRPSGDWLPTTLQTQLQSIQKLRHRLEVALSQLGTNAIKNHSGKRRKRLRDQEKVATLEMVEMEMKEPLQKTRRCTCGAIPDSIEKIKMVASMYENKEVHVKNLEDLDVEACTENGKAVDTQTSTTEDISSTNSIDFVQPQAEIINIDTIPAVEGRMGAHACESELLDTKATVIKEECFESQSTHDPMCETDELPCGLMRINRNDAVRIKGEPMPLSEPIFQEACSHVMSDAARPNLIESPLELNGFESTDSEETTEGMARTIVKELAYELEVPDSDSEDAGI